MTEQSIPELIAEARKIVGYENARGEEYNAVWVNRLVDALEAVTAENESLRRFDWIKRNRRIEAERDAAYAVIEQVRAEAAGAYSGIPAHNIDLILATIPANALREVKAQVWDECVERVRNMGRLDESGIQWLADSNPYREGVDRG